MTPTIFYLGPTDSEYGGFAGRRRSGKGVQLAIGGCLPLRGLYATDETIKKNSTVVVSGYHKEIRSLPAGQVNLFNLVGDAETSSRALGQCAKLAELDKIDRVFNHPRHIRKTTRDRAQRLFAGVPGLVIPKMAAVTATGSGAIQASMDALGLNYPVILRTAGLHGGRGMSLVHNPHEAQQCVARLEANKRLFLIEFIDTRTVEEWYQKLRLIFVDGHYYPRHYIHAREWCIHAGNRQELMLESEQARRQEQAFIENFAEEISARQDMILREMNNRVGLDVWGVDCAILPNGNIVLYEANACMNILPQSSGPNQEFHYLLAPVERIKNAIRTLIVKA